MISSPDSLFSIEMFCTVKKLHVGDKNAHGLVMIQSNSSST